MITRFNLTDEDFAEIFGKCYDRDTELAKWAIGFFDGFDGTEAVNGTNEGECLVTYPDRWYADDGCAEVECGYDGESAREEYVKTGDWGVNEGKTSWVNVASYRKAIDYRGLWVHVDVESDDVEIEPEEPECIDSEGHDWQSPLELVGGIKENPGVWGHGGGVIINAVCVRCGCGKTTDTWAQNPRNGVQGLTSIEYEPAKYDLECLSHT